MKTMITARHSHLAACGLFVLLLAAVGNPTWGSDVTTDNLIVYDASLLQGPAVIGVGATVNDVAAHWRFDEGSGSIAQDSSGNGNHGTVAGAQWVEGRVGGALEFNGVSDYVSVPAMNFDSITVQAWFNRASNDTVCADAIWGGWRWNADVQLYEGFELRFNKTSFIRFVVTTVDAGGTRICKEVVADLGTNHLGQWYHAAGTYDATTGIQRLYVNGVSRGSCNHPPGNVIVPLTYWSDMQIGYSRVNAGWFPGIIDDVWIHNRALSTTEIAAMYRDDALLKVYAPATLYHVVPQGDIEMGDYTSGP